MSAIAIVSLIILLLLAAVTAASEISFIAISRLRLRKLASDGSKPAQIILKILEAPERFFGTILIANNVVGALIAALITVILVSLVGEARGVLFATIIAAFLIIFFEVLAKSYAAMYAERLSLRLARPIYVLVRFLAPVASAFSVVINFITKITGGTKKAKTFITEEEIRAFIKIAQEDGTLLKERYLMLSRVLDLSKTVVRSVMTPKDQIVSFDVDSNIDDMLDKVIESGYSRFPVYKSGPDNIVGIIKTKDLLNVVVNKGLVVLHDIISPPVVVPGSKKVTELLAEFQKGHTHLAIVTGENGKIEGLVTLEDLLEEIVGEIQDEYDIESKS
ncbi:MAG: hemolysin family protein [Candidatus Omnitrophica bacterium]|nr:hemolysin family protein [Candidatus Omnitrophota bacterium]MBU4488711.1 hemolysin family protein [Candidatus Omnitrophota bacterium]MCG2705740.1 hemolysin family protein [Candidatus Omnitrophota bacterium]